MVSLTIWTFPSPYAAEAVVTRLQSLSTSELIRLDDAALVTWPAGRQAPLLRPLAELPRCWMLDDAFWGLLAAVLFHGPQRGPEAADEGEIAHGLAPLGLSVEVLEAIRAQVVEGTSALLLLIEAEVARRIGTAFAGMGYTLVDAPLSQWQQQSLREVFGARG